MSDEGDFSLNKSLKALHRHTTDKHNKPPYEDLHVVSCLGTKLIQISQSKHEK